MTLCPLTRAHQPGGQYPRIVTYNQISTLQKSRKILELMVRPSPAPPLKHHQSRFITRLNRALGNQFLRQVEVKKLNVHKSSIAFRNLRESLDSDCFSTQTQAIFTDLQPNPLVSSSILCHCSFRSSSNGRLSNAPNLNAPIHGLIRNKNWSSEKSSFFLILPSSNSITVDPCRPSHHDLLIPPPVAHPCPIGPFQSVW